MPDRLRSFQDVLAAAIDDILANGFDSQERIDRWSRALRAAAEGSMISSASLEDLLREGLAATYRRMVDQGEILKRAPGVERYTLEQIKPKLRAELDRRIAASANLIKLNRAEAVEQTLRRFQGWSTSIPPGGVSGEKKRAVKKTVRKSLAGLPFEERRVLIDQGHKLVASISEITATDGGAIAGVWRSNWRQPGYDYRDKHKDRDERIYLVRGSWAEQAGLVKPRRGWGYTDDITAPAQEPFCRCYYRWLFNLRDLPEDMLTTKGKQTLFSVLGREEVHAARTARGDDALRPDEAELARAMSVDRLGWHTGLARIRTEAASDRWHASYDDTGDEIVLEPKFFDLGPTERLHVLVHEIGHRGQVVAPDLYREFVRAHLDRLSAFVHMANPVHLEDFERRGFIEGGLAAEVFAESYSRAALGLPMPAELRAFWSDRFEKMAGLISQRAAAYTPLWPNRITRCQRCSMFLRINAAVGDNACSAVDGRISAHGHCRLFEILGVKAAA